MNTLTYRSGSMYERSIATVTHEFRSKRHCEETGKAYESFNTGDETISVTWKCIPRQS